MLQKRLHKEGGAISQLLQNIRQIGYNKVVDIEYGTVTSAQPELEVVLDTDSIPLDANDIVVAWQLGAHERITESGEVIRFRSALEVGDRVIVACMDQKQQWFLLDKVAD
ncbi:DUF2577 domain-containing protein [Bacillus badius]|uniref:DUF2577 family protein n=1 Tax=Bacillus badius TaxID=1455 RepID=UPI001CBA7E9F|nr:DUF2577 family protein [Bacillus badius]UAT30022.1 DUF2577 domain-containing protein [Bacillus badius]